MLSALSCALYGPYTVNRSKQHRVDVPTYTGNTYTPVTQ